MIYKRHYIQYNDLVFDGTDMISEDGYSVSFKNTSNEYSYRHGAYSPSKMKGALAKQGNVSFTLILKMKKLSCEARPYYRRFAMSNLLKPGKLWAVQDGSLVWAYAKIDSFNEAATARKDTVEIDVGFIIPEGVWHKADKQRTFLVPYDKCEFVDCFVPKEYEPCMDGCCDCEKPILEDDCSCCCDNSVTQDMALCYHKNEIQEFYGCDVPYRIVYDCTAAENFFFSSAFGKEHLGQRFCTDKGLIVGKFISDSDLPAPVTRITLHGHVKDPYIEINGNGNRITGEYDGYLTIYEDGTITVGNDCMYCATVEVEAWDIPENMDYGWEILPGTNRIIIQPNICCGTVCAYIEADSLTI